MRAQRIIGKTAAASLAAAFAVSGSGLGAQQAAGWQPNDDDALIFEVQAGKYRFDGTVRGYYTGGGICADLADTIQTLDLPIRLDKKSRRATGWLFSEGRTITIDRDTDTVQIVNKSQKLAQGDIYDTPEGWCVNTKTLSEWFGIEINADRFGLIMKMEGDSSLPFIQALERRSRAARLRTNRPDFDLSALPQADMPYKSWRTPSVDMAVNFDLRGNGSSTSASASFELFASGEAGGVSYDARLAGNSQHGLNSLRMRVFRLDPDGGLFGPLAATEVAIGDVTAGEGILAGRSAVGRGAMITNKPPYRPSSFSKTTLRGAMPAGWDAELYRNNQLIAAQFGSSDGWYEFLDVDLLFGNNDFEVVLYGPQGQIRREASSIPVGQDSIEPGKTYYWAAVIEQGKDLLNFNRDIVDPNTGWRWGVGVERGIDDRTMAGITAQSLVLDGRRQNYLELSVLRSIGRMLVELSASQSFGRGRAYQLEALGKLGKVNFNLQTFYIEGDYESDLIDHNTRSETRFTVDSSLKLGGMRVPVQLAGRREYRRDGSKVNEMLIRASVLRHGLSVTAELANLWTEGTNYGASSGDGLRLNLLANKYFGKFSLRGEMRFNLTGTRTGLQSTKVVGELQLTKRSDLRAQVEYFPRSGQAEFGLGYIREFKRFSLRSDARFGTNGTYGFGLQLATSFGPDPTGGGIRFSHERLARTGQTAVTVFRDDNGDGIRSPGEEPLAGIGIEAGLSSSDKVTNEDGVAIIDGMKPYAPILVSIDQGSLPDPYLQPVGKGVVVTPRPGVSASIELALAPTGEVEGFIYGLAGTPRAGVGLELVDGLGSVVATAISEFDGFFLFDGVPYGRYSLRISEDAAKILGVERSITTEVVISKESEIMRVGIVKLKGNADAIAGDAPTIALARPGG